MKSPEQTFYYVSFVDADGPRVLSFTGQRWQSDGIDFIDWITRQEVDGEIVTHIQSWPGEGFDTVEEAVAHRRAEIERQIHNAREEIQSLQEQLKVATVDRAQVIRPNR